MPRPGILLGTLHRGPGCGRHLRRDSPRARDTTSLRLDQRGGSRSDLQRSAAGTVTPSLPTDSRRGTPAHLPRYTPLHADHPAHWPLPLPDLRPAPPEQPPVLPGRQPWPPAGMSGAPHPPPVDQRGRARRLQPPHRLRRPGRQDLVQSQEGHRPLRRIRPAHADQGVPRPDHREERPEALKVEDPLLKKRRRPRGECRDGDC